MLRGELTALRPFRASDLPIMRDWYRDPATARTWAQPPIVSDTAFEADLNGRFARFGESGYFAIENLDGELIGRADFEHLDPVDRTAEVMIVIGDPGSRGKGAGSDAMRVLLSYLFRDRQAEHVWLTVLAWNEPAIRSYEKIGFIREGRLIEDVWLDGKADDQLVMGILRHEFEAKWPSTPQDA